MKTSVKHKNWIAFLNDRIDLDDLFLNPLSKNLIGVLPNFPDLISYQSTCLMYFKIRNSDKKLTQFLKKIKSNQFFGKINFPFSKEINLSIGEYLNGCILYQFNKEIMLKYPEIRNQKSLKILEIGPGYGEFANLFIDLYKQKKIQYDLIDLDENLIYSKKYLTKTLKDNSEININYFSANDISNINNNYDIIINTHSFQEMKSEVVSNYMRLIYDKMTDESFFFSINTSFKWDIKDYSVYRFQKYFKNICSKSLYSIHNDFYSHNHQLCVFKKLNQDMIPDDKSLMNQMGRLQEYSLDQLILLNSKDRLNFSSDLDLIKTNLPEEHKVIFDYFENKFIKSKLPVLKIDENIINILIKEINKNLFPDRLYFLILLIEKNNHISNYFNVKYDINLKIDMSFNKKFKRYLKRALRISR